MIFIIPHFDKAKILLMVVSSGVCSLSVLYCIALFIILTRVYIHKAY